ncbi:hypothetical protein A2870_03950 [Candidatus Curtissbacteria bacterium RIFCSPHIGHO2_01_FULL_41_11]|uniref:EfeO-type cupredoxin-like domain-containing protein n=1 Tax=Candidatus Curtissbacteria bacterium RIFCSPHIGHO2_01_FULL_41_11 TaxID=1797711 RepID=A0A1F5G7R6_9BACT|nr:MAG: hypothetical protein A2870_03950 [Candidatus Curtissbacteria bacterium RIFCSPHIGHO2_01_FULL_41_11]
MVKAIILISALFALLLTVTGCTPKQPEAASVITFENGTYTPKNTSIKLGQTVTFVNKSNTDMWPASNIHPTHGIYPEFDPKKAVGPGKSWSFTFTKAGIWKFHDHLNPEITGTITVH